MPPVPPLHSIGAGARFGALGRTFGTATGGSAKSASANIGSGSILQAPPARTAFGSAGLKCAAYVVTATAVLSHYGATSFASKATITAVAIKVSNKTSAASLQTSASINGTAVRYRYAVASLSGTERLTATGTKVSNKVATASFASSSTLLANRARSAIASTSLATQSSLFAIGLKQGQKAGVANLGSKAYIAGAAVITPAKTASTSLFSRASLTGTGIVTSFASASLATQLSLSAVATKSAGAIKLGQATLFGSSALTATRKISRSISASLNANTYINAIPSGVQEYCQCQPWVTDATLTNAFNNEETLNCALKTEQTLASGRKKKGCE